MVDIITSRKGVIDLSFMASLECDLSCGHCMYNSSPANQKKLDYLRVVEWTKTIEWSKINACGFYGGEPGIMLDWYEKFIELVPDEVPKFIITNGTWSVDSKKIRNFLAFSHKYNLNVVVSGTRWHTPFQNRGILIDLMVKGLLTLKGEETNLIPMGKAAKWLPKGCTQVCQQWSKPWRIAIHPENDIIFQSCDGSYPHLQTLNEPFGNVTENITNLLTHIRETGPCK